MSSMKASAVVIIIGIDSMFVMNSEYQSHQRPTTTTKKIPSMAHVKSHAKKSEVGTLPIRV
jgi:hypothetical protein